MTGIFISSTVISRSAVAAILGLAIAASSAQTSRAEPGAERQPHIDLALAPASADEPVDTGSTALSEEEKARKIAGRLILLGSLLYGAGGGGLPGSTAPLR